MRIMIAIAGIALILALALLLSRDRSAIRLRVVGAAFALQAGLALLVLKVPAGRATIAAMSDGVAQLLGYAHAGTAFIFGPLASAEIGGTSFAISALPAIIFFASLISILYHLGIMQFAVKWVGGGIEKVTGISRVESLCAASNIFVGQSESPLVIRPYLAALTPAQLFTVMTCGMAGVAGTILAAYAAMGIDVKYLLAAAFMSAPGGILMAKIIMPDDPHAGRHEADEIVIGGLEEEKAANVIMAAAQGAQIGVKLAVLVGAMVLAFVALVAMANGLLAGISGWFGMPDLSFQWLLGQVFAPVMYLLNIPTSDIQVAGGLFGTKVVINEFVAFVELGRVQDQLSPYSVAVITFALCGFANFASIAIQMAVTGSLAPNQRPMLARLGLRALAAGSLANLMSAALAGFMLSF